MSETKKRKVHTPEFNAKVGLEALRGVKTINQFGQDYDVHTPPVQIRPSALFRCGEIPTDRTLRQVV